MQFFTSIIQSKYTLISYKNKDATSLQALQDKKIIRSVLQRLLLQQTNHKQQIIKL